MKQEKTNTCPNCGHEELDTYETPGNAWGQIQQECSRCGWNSMAGMPPKDEDDRKKDPKDQD